MPAANDEKKPPPEEAAPPPWSLDPIAGDLRGEERAAAHQSVARVGGKRLRVWGGGRSGGFLRIGEGRGAERRPRWRRRRVEYEREEEFGTVAGGPEHGGAGQRPARVWSSRPGVGGGINEPGRARRNVGGRDDHDALPTLPFQQLRDQVGDHHPKCQIYLQLTKL